jgi:hypothetical protein
MRTYLLLIAIVSAGCIGDVSERRAPTPPGAPVPPAVPPAPADPGAAPPVVDPGAVTPPVVDPGSSPPVIDPPAPPSITPPPSSVPPPSATTPPPPAGACVTQRAIPADAQAVLQVRCQVCHASRPLTGVTGSLVTVDDFMRPSKLDPNRNVGQLVIARINDPVAGMPPPPGAPLTATERSALESWIGALQVGCPTPPAGGVPPAGLPPPVVSQPPPPSIFDTPARCTSGRFFRPTGRGGDDDDGREHKGGGEGGGEGGGGDDGDHGGGHGGDGHGDEGGGGSPVMNPGRACISCHATESEAPRFDAAGTIYPSAHEPNDCNGVNANGAAAVVVDANGKTVTARANAAGNFFIAASENLQPPLRAKVVFMGRERIMLRSVPSADCNGCHTQGGTQMAPGRIVLP